MTEHRKTIEQTKQKADKPQWSQKQNRENAMRILSSRIHHRLMTEHRKTIEQTKQKADKPQWSNQIRSYILHPKQMVVDHRTKVKTHDAAAVLDGNIDHFIDAMLMKRRKRNENR